MARGIASAGGRKCGLYAASGGAAIPVTGTVYAWGANGTGELGQGTQDFNNHPIPMLALSPGDPSGTGYLTGVARVAPAIFHTAALKGDGTVYTWGIDEASQLGYTNTNASYCQFHANCQTTAKMVSGLGGVEAIAAGHGHTLAL